MSLALTLIVVAGCVYLLALGIAAVMEWLEL